MRTIITISLLLFITGGIAMAYDVHISRGYKYAESGHTKISLDEWRQAILEHDELESIEYVETTNPSTKEVIRIETPNSAMFKRGQIEIFLTWKNGIIITKYTNDSDKAYWKEIANWFNAQLFGEEGESI
jgi:hypothetical protein